MQKEVPSLRVEANSIPNETLSESQREAFKQIVHSLAETVRDLKTPNGAKDHQGTDGVDDDRKSRTMMISGDRGTGKTTLMLTLQNRITKDRTPIDEKEFGLDCKTQLEEIRGRIVWLEPLDMEHSSNTTNLFVSILARIDDAIKACFRDGYRGDDPYGMSVSTIPGSDDLLMELRRLEVDASLAWEGNLVARAPSLDSDAYATEVMRAERARMKINPRFRDLLEKIATRLHWGPKISNPIFVLAVDDFDLNPSRCLDILKLIRSLNVPRLFTLVLGDEEVAEEVFRLDIQGVMSRIANVAIDARDGAASSFIRRMKHLSPQAVRKLVPPHQRLKLTNNTIEQSLKVKPSSDSISLEELLKNFSLYTELPNENIAAGEKEIVGCNTLYEYMIDAVPDFMLPKRNPIDPDNQLQRRRYRYKGGRILETSLRETIDLWYAINRIAGKENTGETKTTENKKMLLIEESRKWVRRAVYDDALIDMDSAERFIYEFESDIDPEIFRTYNLELNLPLPKSHRIQTDHFQIPGLDLFADLSVSYIEEFKLLYNKGRSGSRTENHQSKGERGGSGTMKETYLQDYGCDEQNNLSTKTQSHLVLLHDLIATNPLTPVVGDYLVKPIDRYGIVTCNWKFSGTDGISVPWRGAIFRTVRELEVFANSWDLFIEKLRENYHYELKPDVDLIAWGWFFLNLTTFLGIRELSSHKVFEDILRDSPAAREKILLTLLGKAINHSKNGRFGRARAEWLLYGLFSNLFPSSGMSAEFCASLLKSKHIREWKVLHEDKIQDLHDSWFDKHSELARDLKHIDTDPRGFFKLLKDFFDVLLNVGANLVVPPGSFYKGVIGASSDLDERMHDSSSSFAEYVSFLRDFLSEERVLESVPAGTLETPFTTDVLMMRYVGMMGDFLNSDTVPLYFKGGSKEKESFRRSFDVFCKNMDFFMYCLYFKKRMETILNVRSNAK